MPITHVDSSFSIEICPLQNLHGTQGAVIEICGGPEADAPKDEGVLFGATFRRVYPS
jgi:hypothetical protein